MGSGFDRIPLDIIGGIWYDDEYEAIILFGGDKRVMSFSLTKGLAGLLVVSLLFLWTGDVQASANSDLPQFEAESVILIEGRTGTVLYAKQPQQKMYPASITKIVTGIVALESGVDLNSMVKVSKEARNEQGTRVYLEEGEEQTLNDMIHAMLINSGNDASTAIAEFLDGSKEQFARRMNALIAEKVGVTDSYFTNPHGLPDPLQVTTAQDMALIARYAMQNEQFRAIVGTKKRPWPGVKWNSDLENHNRLLGSYEGATGIKNGYTSAAGFTLVASAKRDGMELIGVIMKAQSNKLLYQEMTHLLDYGFRGFELQKLFSAGEIYEYMDREKEAVQGQQGKEGPVPAAYTAEEEIWAVVPKGEQGSMSVEKDGAVYVTTSQGKQLAGQLSVPALAGQRIAGEPASDEGVTDTGSHASPVQLWMRYMVFAAWLLLITAMILIAVLRWRRRREMR